MVNTSSLLRVLIPNLLQRDPTLLSSLIDLQNHSIYQEVIKHLYGTLLVVLPTNLESSPLLVSNKVNAVLQNPRLGAGTKAIRFRHSSSSRTDIPTILTGHLPGGDAEMRIAAWTMAADIIACCPNIQILEWDTTFGIGGALWDAISPLTNLTHLLIGHPPIHPAQDPNRPATTPFSRITPRLQLLVTPDLSLQPGMEMQNTNKLLTRGSILGNGGWGLGAGWESLEVMKVGPLSETGAKTVANHLTLLSMRPCSLTSISLETQFLDILLCNSISRVGSLGMLTHVELSTTGTRLTAECLNTIITGCVSLESLKLSGVDGHLSKDTWSMIQDWPATFVSLEIVIPEYSKRFSWILDHLDSIHHVPIAQLRHFAIRRNIHPINLLPFPPADAPTIATCRSDMALQPIPSVLVQAIIDNGHQLERLSLDWWEVDQEGFAAIMKNCTTLKTLEVALSAPISQVLNVPTSFAKLPLERLILTSDPAVYPANFNGKLKVDCVAVPDGLPTFLRDRISESDNSLLDPRDLKKLARRLPKLQSLAWVGKGGRGEWRFEHKSAQSSMINIDFTHLAITTREIWEQCQDSSPPSWGDVMENPSVGVSLEIPSVPATPAVNDSVLWRIPTVDTDTLIKTPSTRKSSLADVDSDLKETPLDDELVPDIPLIASKTILGTPKVLQSSRPSKPISLNSPSSPNRCGRGQGTSLPSARSSQPVSPRPTDPKSPSSSTRRGSTRSWHGIARKSLGGSQTEEDMPRLIPGSGGRQSLPVENLSSGFKKAMPERPKERVKEKKEARSENISPKSEELGWTVVGGSKKPEKDDKIKKRTLKKSKK
ncbi:hypothetical protein I302_104461 [Kwoniella bestiolae CBS 10118]|uniref:Uncharacterized protein n=1 Tax=Kwoniella bestiolae CBS 10118 TaxID=1296100 RepID=A0A1B9GBB7_9TREE|nr:hypothetical protein I302_03165 [Kwoniella bestiolae CBS 10118]OCF28309.1 hypothetical protein I302_03165 [Kwoniella bestiolae CBS 10118]